MLCTLGRFQFNQPIVFCLKLQSEKFCESDTKYSKANMQAEHAEHDKREHSSRTLFKYMLWNKIYHYC